MSRRSERRAAAEAAARAATPEEPTPVEALDEFMDEASDVDGAAVSIETASVSASDPDAETTPESNDETEPAADPEVEPLLDPTSDLGEPGDDPAVLSELRGRLDDLQSAMRELIDRAGTTVAPTHVEDPEIDNAARTLHYAQQTADQVIAEAREEAAAIVADAERQRSEIIRRARQQADLDYTAERDRVVAASAAWHAQRTEVLLHIEALTSVFDRYHEGLSELDAIVTTTVNELRSGPSSHDVTSEWESPGDRGRRVAEAHLAAVANLADESQGDDRDSTESDPGNDDEFAPGRDRPAGASPSATFRVVGADADPFVFDVAELPESIGDFGWEADDPGSEAKGSL